MIRKALFILFFSATTVGSFAQLRRDSVIVKASLQYEQPNLFKRIFHGNNYREDWATPVKMPVFDINNENGGFVIAELGGGEQTRSLKLLDKNGREWALRSVDKEVDKAMPPILRNTFAEKITQDFISASYPYGALTIHTFTAALNIPAPAPRVFFVPDDPAFGAFRLLFGNTVCFLEQRDPTPDGSKSLSTDELIQALSAGNESLVMQHEVLRARLIDMLVADWDRHNDQWRWGLKDSAGLKYYYAIPRDRDQAYFHSNGLVIKPATLIFPHMNGFKANGKKIKNLSYKTWDFDRQFLNQLDRKEWENIITEFQQVISDALIETAINRLPPEIQAVSGERITNTLKARRNRMKKEVMEYYEFLASSVEITGTTESEYFVVEGIGKNLRISVYDYSQGAPGTRIYTRLFDPKDTKKISLTGMDGNDRFEFKGDKPMIKVTMDGGRGKDQYDVASKSNIKVNDDDRQ